MRLVSEKLAAQPFTRFLTMLAQVPSLLKLGSYRTVAGMVRHHIKHPLLRQAFSIHPLLVGGNPFSTTSIYTLIHYLERRWGVYFCMGGTGRLVSELFRLMERTGVGVVKNTDIEEILIKNGLATGARCQNGTIFMADWLFVTQIHPQFMARCYPKQFHDGNVPSRSTNKCSAGLLFFGTRKTYPDLAHHTIWMGLI